MISKMNHAAVRAMVTMVKNSFGDSNNDNIITFGSKYIIPKSSNHRSLKEVVPAFTLAVKQNSAAQIVVENPIGYTNQLVNRITN